VVATIQALDQYGHVIAQAKNSNDYMFNVLYQQLQQNVQA
jgi:hypothetical protein